MVFSNEIFVFRIFNILMYVKNALRYVASCYDSLSLILRFVTPNATQNKK